MNADARAHATEPTADVVAPNPSPTAAPGASVVLLRPRRLRGTIGIIRRPVPGGWEVEIRSANGTPLHLTLPERALHLR